MSNLKDSAKIYLESYANKYIDYPEHKFSDKFESDMKAVIKRQKLGFYIFGNHKRKTYIILVAAILTLIMTVTAGAISQGGLDNFIKYGFFKKPSISTEVKNVNSTYKPVKNHNIIPDNDKNYKNENGYSKDIKNWTYDILNDENGNPTDTITITGYKGNNVDLKMPDYIDDKQVVSVDSYALYNNNEIKTVIIPDTIIKLNEYAIYGCENIKSIRIANSVNIISDKAVGYIKDENTDDDIIVEDCVIICGKYSEAYKYAMENSFCVDCSEVKHMPEWEYVNYNVGIAITAYNRNNKEVVIPDTIKGRKVLCIETGAFEGNNYIESITISESVKLIKDGAYKNCPNLTNIKILNDSLKIDAMAFANDFTENSENGYADYSFNQSLTITAPADSSAKVYANQHNIVFAELVTDDVVSSDTESHIEVSSEVTSSKPSIVSSKIE